MRLRAAVLTILLALGARTSGGAPIEDGAVDSDGDGLSDSDEVHKYRTDPHEADSDGDGVPDGQGEERREFTYSIRLVVEHLPPADAITDAWQDARVLKRSDDAVTLEITAYPLADPQADSPDRPDRRDAKFREFTKPNLTCDFDAGMTKDLTAALKKDDIDPAALGDKSLVEKVSTWAFARSHAVGIGFTSYCVTSKNGRLAVEPGLEPYVAKACAKKPECDDGAAVPVPAKRTTEQQFDAEVRGRAMFRDRVHGSCTSSAVYLQTILRALGVPTRTTVAMPPADGNDDAQKEMLAAGLRPSALRDAILEGPHGGWTEHTFDVVRVGGRWRRLNYDALDQPVVDRVYLGLMLRILDYDDLSASGVSATWGWKWAIGMATKLFPKGNPYRLREVSDLLGPHATVVLPPPRAAAPPAAERTTLTIASLAWTTDLTAASLHVEAPDLFEAAFAESTPGESYEPYTRFAKDADLHFVLRAAGHPDVPALYTWTTMPRAEGKQHLIFGVDRKALARGVAYALVPLNETGTNRWAVADGVTLSR